MNIKLAVISHHVWYHAATGAKKDLHKTVQILLTTFAITFMLIEGSRFFLLRFDKILLTGVQIYNKSTLVQVVPWHRTYDRPLPE